MIPIWTHKIMGGLKLHFLLLSSISCIIAYLKVLVAIFQGYHYLSWQRPDLSSLKVPKEWDICWTFIRKRLKCPAFLVREGPKNYKGVRGHAPPENLFKSLEMHRRVRHFSLKPLLLGASMLIWSAWANTLAYTSYNNGWKSWRNKKIGRTRTDFWTLDEVHCQWRNEFGIHEHFWKLKREYFWQRIKSNMEYWERFVIHQRKGLLNAVLKMSLCFTR